MTLTARKFFWNGQYSDAITVVDETGMPESKSGATSFGGRKRVTSSTPLLNANNVIDPDTNFWSEITAGAGTITHNPTTSLKELAVTTASGDSVINQTIRYCPYSAGHGMSVKTTFIMAAAQTGLVQRVGFFDAGNGIFLEQNGAAVSVVVRDNSTGTPVDTTYAQASWTDPLDGTGPSGYILDLTKIQLFTIEYEWSGAGAVRFSLDFEGMPYNFLQVQHANVASAPYMALPNLPVRFEISNTATTAIASTMYVSCAIVEAEETGDIEGSVFVCDAGQTAIATSTTATYNMLVRMKKYINGVPNRRSLEIVGGNIYNAGADTIYRLTHNTTPTYDMTLSGVTGTFAPGDTITGGTSGATATVTAVNGTTLSYQETNQFNFQAAEIVTGAPSGATATIASVTTWLTTADSPFEYALSTPGFTAAYQILIYSSILATSAGNKGLAGDFPSSDLNKHGDINLDYTGFNPQVFALRSTTLTGAGTTWSSLVFRNS